MALLEVELENFDLTSAHIGQAEPDTVFEVRRCQKDRPQDNYGTKIHDLQVN